MNNANSVNNTEINDSETSESAKKSNVKAKDTGVVVASEFSVLKASRIFIDPPKKPTQEGPYGIRFDFNDGCRIEVPELVDGTWRIRFSDMETANIIFEATAPGGIFQSTKVYYVPFKVEIWRENLLVFVHEYSAKSRKILIQIPVGTLGDAIAWFPYADIFQRKHDCDLTCVMSDAAMSIFAPQYPNINFVTPADAEFMQEDFYATYRMGLFFDDWNCTYQPVDFRYVGLHKTAAYILGVEPVEVPPRIDLATTERMIAEPYVCIAVQSSTQCKYWNNPYGWGELVKWLKACGYRVICIDKDAVYGSGMVWNHIPHGAEDMTGPIPLPERAALLKHAEFFVGLSSGLAWLAWATGVPVVMISGFTHPNNEFYTPYRVFNHHTCNSCWNDPKVRFDHFDFLWCPRHKGTDRQFECTRLITVDHVKRVISKIPGFFGETRGKHSIGECEDILAC